ncbi:MULTISPECIES: hypothetical protein [unclassified Moorena]|uniref:hypothetical protein n=1 Tax=unclassified Moorena TaxID=2683338 RepID=UPI0013FFE692|nr:MULTISPECIES: hypothetical protein [unclassified Moorena]NEO11343.1 hypothetical protein [Moorena sp. SIO3E8]NEP99179.1 hypothetical protein [Moorena sp. SIO3F7]
MLVLKIFIVSICATRTLREQRSAVSRQLKAHATGTAYFIQKHRLRYGHAARTVAWHRLWPWPWPLGHAVRTTL